ncbi:helix-turn-helix transcriptional regulator [Thermoactinomyces sp. DSM 45892]|uniref:helix-turn-helix transcriptional regulator n=1 Tax=Thermoactinomyces sp. DSM 45892 TaxID=1882753 RepID=UPI000899D20A|nr:helix-turn-helix transcriptional regulator [Thermoactinomyces sp. DSM 45892]SDZ00095.1 Helix-turn-helix [Thermoactinomyces sp. DSM 45892]
MNKKLIGSTLRYLRGNRKRKEVSKAVQISVSALSSYENGSRIPLDEIKVRIANYYGLTVQDVFFNQYITEQGEDYKHGSLQGGEYRI